MLISLLLLAVLTMSAQNQVGPSTIAATNDAQDVHSPIAAIDDGMDVYILFLGLTDASCCYIGEVDNNMGMLYTLSQLIVIDLLIMLLFYGSY